MPKFATEYWLETNSRVAFYPATTVPTLPVTAVKIYIFQDDKLLLTNIKSRGWDLPGGHIEPGETPRAAVIRELHEETGAVAKRLGLIGYLKITNQAANERNKRYPKESCILIYRGYDATVDAGYDFKLEATESKFVSVDQLPQTHHDWNEAKAQVVEFAYNYALA